MSDVAIPESTPESGPRKRKERSESAELVVEAVLEDTEPVIPPPPPTEPPALSGLDADAATEEPADAIATRERDAIHALQQLYSQSAAKKPRRQNLSKTSTEVLTSWFFEHIDDPYPTDAEKDTLVSQTGLNLTQVNNWFSNKRIRYKRKLLKRAQKEQDLYAANDEDEYRG